jgi:hypothetical protein
MAWRRAREQAVLKPSEEAPGGSASERAEAGQEEADSIKYNRFGGLALAGELCVACAWVRGCVRVHHCLKMRAHVAKHGRLRMACSVPRQMATRGYRWPHGSSERKDSF